jgi:hypothetical protein
MFDEPGRGIKPREPGDPRRRLVIKMEAYRPENGFA